MFYIKKKVSWDQWALLPRDFRGTMRVEASDSCYLQSPLGISDILLVVNTYMFKKANERSPCDFHYISEQK